MYKLRDYQQRTCDLLRAACRTAKRRMVVQSPTGSGKTLMMADMLNDGEPQIVLVHRKILLDQLAKTLTTHGIPFGFRAAGYRRDSSKAIQLAMIQTETSRLGKDNYPLHKCTRLHIDEPHAQKGEKTWGLLDKYFKQGASVIGWSATPAELGFFFEEKVISATVPQLIAEGHLVPPVLFGPEVPDMEKLERVAKMADGNYVSSELSKIWKPAVIFARVLEMYRLLNPDENPTVLFADSVASSVWFAQTLTAQGVRAAHIDGNDVWLDGEIHKSDRETRARVFKELREGTIKIVCNRFVLREGWDEPCVSHCILATPVGSTISYIQMVGRILRPYEGKTQAVIQDHGGNWINHPPIDSDIDWDLFSPDRTRSQGRVEDMRDQKISEPIYCPQCNAIRTMGDECPICGFHYPKRSRCVRQVSGELKLIHGPIYKQRHVVYNKTDEQVWAGLYSGNLKHHPQRTPAQIRSYHAFKNNWNWLPKNLPLMPRDNRDWFVPVGDLDPSKLR